MNLGDRLPWIGEQLELLGRDFAGLTLDSALEALGTRGLPEVDSAVRAYAAMHQWPALSTAARFELCLRLECARSYCAELAQTAEDDSLPEFLESMLIEYWQDVGRVDWLYYNFVAPDRLPPGA